MKLPKRKPNTHKGDYGKVFVLAGSEGMLGAAILCSRGALRVGAGLVYLSVPGNLRDTANLAAPEVIISNFDPAYSADAVVIGPGLGARRRDARDLLFKLNLKKFKAPIILDADGLNAFLEDKESLKKLDLDLVLTPHPGELSRLLDRPITDIQKNREKSAVEAAKLFNCLVVLKGHRTVIADKSGKVKINQTGNPGMATAGVGDVLAGMIAGLAGQGIKTHDAAILGVYLHGLAGDLAAKEKGEYGMIASDLVEKIPAAILKAK
ncbi:NAD(P)H-hydrate dehydratase [Candidatus Saganbacteria bacterium]|nr:NAD(P)H-hydrate dehydratase [Candidatus Saganbacteria bacterium]